MASPAKRLKLTPKKTASPRTTQESKITSTPQGSIEASTSPDVSKISSAKSVKSRLSDVFETDESSIHDSVASSILESDLANTVTVLGRL